MRINYALANQTYTFSQEDEKVVKNMNFLLTNNKGDFLNLGIFKNTCKYQGLNVCDPKTLKMFKFLDEISLVGLDVCEVSFDGFVATRKFVSKVADLVEGDSALSVGSEVVDRFFLGPTGGVVYEISGYEGDLIVDLDMRAQNDFDEWGREYNVYEEDGLIFVEYSKTVDKNEDYKLYFALKSANLVKDYVKDFVKKEYDYSKERNSLYERYVYRLFSAQVGGSKRIVIGAGFSKDEAKEQIGLLDLHQKELEKFDLNIVEELVKDSEFEKPLSQDVATAYKLCNNAVYRFLNKDLEKPGVSSGMFAGFPWFTNIWTRDELVGLRALINNSDEKVVKDILFKYLNLINDETGLLTRIQEDGALESADGVFWLAKRFEDFIYHADGDGRLANVVTNSELKQIYDKMHNSFAKIVERNWDVDNELLRVKYGDSWMDTIEVNFPIDIQVQFLELVSFLVVLAQLINKKDELEHLKEFEKLLVSKIRAEYYRDGYLYNSVNQDRISSNVFLVYYFYPGLFEQEEWEKIFDNSLNHLKTHWGGVASLSQRDSRFRDEYTGENNLSYHNGDVWFWINNYAAIAMSHLNERKYRDVIAKILSASSADILKRGTVGFASEVSSAKEQRAQGCMAQLWSCTTYLELVDQLFERK